MENNYLFESHAHFSRDQLFPIGKDNRIPDLFSGRITLNFPVQSRRFPSFGVSIVRPHRVDLKKRVNYNNRSVFMCLYNNISSKNRSTRTTTSTLSSTTATAKTTKSETICDSMHHFIRYSLHHFAILIE